MKISDECYCCVFRLERCLCYDLRIYHTDDSQYKSIGVINGDYNYATVVAKYISKTMGIGWKYNNYLSEMKLNGDDDQYDFTKKDPQQ